MIEVSIIQPVIPDYRVPLFSSLAENVDMNVKVHASRRMPGAPPLSSRLGGWADVSHDCTALLGERVFWQSNLRLPKGCGPGDVLVISGNPRFISNIPLITAARRQGTGLLWWGHGHSATTVGWRAALRHQMMRLADAILLYTDEEVAALQSKYRWKTPMFGLNNTLNLSDIRRATSEWDSESLRKFREGNGLVGKKLLLFCGRLRSNPSTELDVAFKALQVLAGSQQEYMLAVIGSGDEESMLKRIATATGVEHHVRWLGSLYKERDLAPWFLTAKCFVYPGPIGLSLMHAFGYGLPVITHAQRSAHNPEIAALREAYNGLTFRRGNAEHLAQQVCFLCESESRRETMAKGAVCTVNGSYSFVSMVDRFSCAIRAASEASRKR